MKLLEKMNREDRDPFREMAVPIRVFGDHKEKASGLLVDQDRLGVIVFDEDGGHGLIAIIREAQGIVDAIVHY